MPSAMDLVNMAIELNNLLANNSITREYYDHMFRRLEALYNQINQ